jgi:hypothetical protein
MKTTKRYKLLLFLPFFLSLPSLASDSLKVKKTEYYEDGKLVRAIFFNKSNLKMKEYFYNYSEAFDSNFKNSVFVFKFKDGKHYSITDYYIKIEGNNAIFYQAPFIGSIQSVERDSLGHFTEANAMVLTLKAPYTKQICSLDSTELIPVSYEKGFKKKYYNDKFGNILETKFIDRANFGKKTYFQYDSLHNQIGYFDINKPYKTKSKTIYQNEFKETTIERYLKSL